MTDTSYEFYMMRGPSPGTIFTLKNKNMTIGRDPLSDVLIDDAEVSRQHALLISAPSGEIRIQDLGSTNGTFVDKERVGSSPVTLRLLNSVTLGGEVTLIFRERSIREQAEPMESDEIPQIDADEAPEGSSEPSRIGKQGSQQDLPQELQNIEPVMSAEQPLKELKQAKPAYLSRQQTAGIDTGDNIPAPSQIDADASEGLTPNLILGLVLLLLCCSASMLVFLIYSGGDSLLRQLGLVP